MGTYCGFSSMAGMDDVSIIKCPDTGDEVEEAVPLFASDAEAEPEVEEAF